MGLDMYVFAIRTMPSKPVDFEKVETVSQVHDWRKHPNLHGWMAILYREKGGEDPDFNCAPVVLTSDDIDRLERHLKMGILPITVGPFFGYSDGLELEDDLFFIDKARLALARGWTIYYTSWW